MSENSDARCASMNRQMYSNSRKRARSEDERGSRLSDAKPRRLNAASVSEVKSESGNGSTGIVTSKPELQDAYARPEVVNRSRRLLGSLMGHLDLARRKLEKDSALISRQQQRVQVVTQKHMEESQRLTGAVRLKRLKKKLDEEVRKAETDMQKELQHLRQRRNTIHTLATPSLAWSPVRHNAVTSKLLNEHQSEIDKQMADREEEGQRRIQKLREEFEKETGKIIPDSVSYVDTVGEYDGLGGTSADAGDGDQPEAVQGLESDRRSAEEDGPVQRECEDVTTLVPEKELVTGNISEERDDKGQDSTRILLNNEGTAIIQTGPYPEVEDKSPETKESADKIAVSHTNVNGVEGSSAEDEKTESNEHELDDGQKTDIVVEPIPEPEVETEKPGEKRRSQRKRSKRT